MDQPALAAVAVAWRAEGGDPTMTDDERAAWALFRWRLISPLLDPACTRADRRDFLGVFASPSAPRSPGDALGPECPHA